MRQASGAIAGLGTFAARVTLGALAVLATLASLAALATPAHAHQTSVKYVDVTVDGARAALRMTVAPGDVTEPLGLPADAQPAVAQVLTPQVAAYVAGWIALAGDDGAPCPPAPPRVRPDADGRFVVVEWDATCPGEIAGLALDLRAFFAVDQRHEAIVTVHAPGEAGEATVVRAADPVLRVHPGAPVGLAAWIGSGVEHIATGLDHVCFVLSLLLVVMLVRVRDGGGDRPRWALRPALATLRHAAAIVTSFTVAHSLSLIAASLGWLALPSRLVESLIAFSILYTALENIARPDVRWRFALTFAFGLIHGLGFASMLAVMLPPERVVGPLLGFNLGVELGQLAIVVVALPLAWLAARVLGAERYRRRAMPALSIAIAAIAVVWLIERAFDLTLTAWAM
jgi:HupE / UreJ protein